MTAGRGLGGEGGRMVRDLYLTHNSIGRETSTSTDLTGRTLKDFKDIFHTSSFKDFYGQDPLVDVNEIKKIS